MSLQEHLTNEVLGWEKVGHPALMQRFVLRNGKAYKNDNRVPKRLKREKNQCFRNATHYCRDFGGIYVEGYVRRPDLPILIHHAWVATDDDCVIDHTLRNSETVEYFGVPFDTELVISTVARQSFYGILDTGLGLNTKLMFKIDPGLESVVKNVKPDPAFVAVREKLKRGL